MAAETYTPIPDLPGYAVNDRGQVMGKRGLLLHDSRGCVNVRQGASVRKMYPGELLSLAGWQRGRCDRYDRCEPYRQTSEALAKADGRVAELEGLLQKAETEAEFMRSRAARFEKRLDELALESVDAGKAKPKPPKPSPASEALALQECKARCKMAEARCQKAIAQRDNLAARLLAMRVDLANAKARVKIAKATAGRSMALGDVENLEDL